MTSDSINEQRRQSALCAANYPSAVQWWDALPAIMRGGYLRDFGLKVLSGMPEAEAAESLVPGVTTLPLIGRGIARRLDALRVLYDVEELALIESITLDGGATIEAVLRENLRELVRAMIRGGGEQAERLWQMHEQHNAERLHPETAWHAEPEPPGEGALSAPDDPADWWKQAGAN